jgi:CRP-like cAMP-binding protein
MFHPLPAPQLEAVARRATWLTVRPGTRLIREGEPGDRFYVLASGSLDVDRGGRHLREVDVVGDGVGEIALLRGVPRTATVTARTDVSLLAIDRAPFLAAVTGHPAAFAAAERAVAGREM